MAETSALKIIIDAENRAKAQIQEAKDGIAGLGNDLEKMKPAFQKMAIVGAAGFAAVSAAVYKTTQAYMAQERAEARLTHLVKQTTGASKEEAKALMEQAAALQKVGVVGDEVTIMGQSQLATFALSTDAIKTLTPSLLDLAVATKGANVEQGDMINLGNLIGRVMEGNVSALTRYGVVMNDTQKEQLELGDEMERATILSEILQQNFGGLNEATRETAEGGLAAMRNEFGDLQELIGQAFLPIITTLVEKLTPLILKAQEWVKENQGLVLAIALVAGAVSLLLMGLGSLGLILPILIKNFLFLKSTMIGAKLAAIALTAVPIIALFTVLALAIGIVINELHKFGKEVGGIRNAWYLTIMQMKIVFLEFVETIISGLNDLIYRHIPGVNKAVSSALGIIRKEIDQTKKDFDALAIEGMKKAEEAGEDLGVGFEEFGEIAKKVMGDATKSVSGLKSEVQDTAKEIADVNKKYKDQMESDEENFYNSLARKVAEYEIDVKDMHGELERAEAEHNDSRARDLVNTINKKQRELNKFYSWDINIEKEIDWEKTLIKAGELERMYLEYNKKREIAEEEHNKLLGEIKERDIKKAEASQADLVRIENDKNVFVKAENTKTEAVERRIEVQRRASLEMGGGFTTAGSTVPFYGFQHGGVVPGRIGEPVPALVHGGETIIPAGKGIGGLTINVYGDVTGQEIIDKVGRGLMDLIKRNKRI